MKSFFSQIFWLFQFLALGTLAFRPLYPSHVPSFGGNARSPFKTLSLKGKTPASAFPPRPAQPRALVKRHNSLLTIAELTSVSVAEQASNLEALGNDALVFLISAVMVVPVFKLLRLSPILGFLGVGCAFGPYGLKFIKELDDLNILAEFGILFLLFEQGLELSLDRIRVLSKVWARSLCLALHLFAKRSVFTYFIYFPPPPSSSS